MSEWYAASLTELKALLDELGEKGEVTLRPGDVAVGAIVGALNAASVVAALDEQLHRTVATLKLLEVGE